MKDNSSKSDGLLSSVAFASFLALPLMASAQWQPVPDDITSVLMSHWSVVDGPLSLESRDLALASCDVEMKLAGLNGAGPSPAGSKLLQATQAKGEMQISKVGEDLVLTTDGVIGGDWNKEDYQISFDRIELKGATQAGNTIIVQAEITARHYEPGFFDQTVFAWSGMSDADKIGSRLLFGLSVMESSSGSQTPIIVFPLSEFDGQPNDETKLYVRCSKTDND